MASRHADSRGSRVNPASSVSTTRITTPRASPNSAPSARSLADSPDLHTNFDRLNASSPNSSGSSRSALRNGAAGRQIVVQTSYRLNNTTLSAAAAAGATTIAVANVANFAAGDSITIDQAANGFGKGDPEKRTMRQWQSPGGEKSSLYAVAVDAQDRVWYVETGPEPNRIVGFDTKAEEFVSINDIPSGGGSVRDMVFDKPTNTIWFGTDTHTIGRAVVP